MQRVVITVDGAGPNIGSPTVLAVSGRIRMVQFALTTDGTAGSGIVQLGTQPSLSAPIQNTGQNPPEIALAMFELLLSTTATQAYAGSSYQNIMVPCDFPVTIGMQLFVNSQGIQINGYIVAMVE